MPRGERGGATSRAKSVASLDVDGGGAPLLVQSDGGAAADLTTNAQVTPAFRRVVHTSWARNIARHALTMGGVIETLGRVRWEVAGDCQSPVTAFYEGRPEGRIWSHPGAPIVARKNFEFRADGQDHDRPITVIMEVPCRRCTKCLRRRSAHWRLRAQAELSAAPRTWFGTLTLTPETHWTMQARAMSRLHAGGTLWELLSPDEQFTERHREISKEITLWLKRIRKESGAKLRYILVAEAHKSGLPHYHCLVHETGVDDCVRYRTLNGQWRLGFSRFELVDSASPAARYVCKYLSKTALARVRASVEYGNTALEA
jgi:hypothetical protein